MALIEQVAETVRDLVGVGDAPTPFVLRKGVEVIWPQNRTYQPYLLQAAIQNKHITQRALDVTEAIYRHRYLSAVQIRQLFFAESDKKSAKYRIEAMVKWGLINRIKFSANGRVLPLQVYLLDRGGASILKDYHGRDLKNWRFEQNIKSYEYMMRILAANDLFKKFNEFAVSLDKRSVECGIFGFEIEPYLKLSEKAHHYVTPTARFFFRRGDREVNFLIEVIRGTDIFERLPSKLTKLNEFYAGFSADQGNRPVTIFLAEREDQLLKVEETIRLFQLTFIKDFARYTTDQRLGTSLISESLCKIEGKNLVIAKFKSLLKTE